MQFRLQLNFVRQVAQQTGVAGTMVGLLNQSVQFECEPVASRASTAVAHYRAVHRVAEQHGPFDANEPPTGALSGPSQDRSQTPIEGIRGQNHPRTGQGHCLRQNLL